MSIGGSEFLIIALVALLLFGPSLLAFWFGYILGQRKREETAETSPTEPSAKATPQAAAQGSDAQPSSEAPSEGPSAATDDAE